MNSTLRDRPHPLLIEVVRQARRRADGTVLSSALGAAMVGVRLPDTAGIASHTGSAPQGMVAPPLPESAHALADWLAAPPPLVPHARSLGMAAVNALLPPPEGAQNIKGQDLLLERGRGANVAVVGHFPFVERLRDDFATFTVLELAPRPGDLPAASADTVLPAADVVAITGTTLLNGTLPGLLALVRKDAFVMLLGPSTPFAPVLFEHGVSALAGAVVDDPDAALDAVAGGAPFRKLPGVRSLVAIK